MRFIPSIVAALIALVLPCAANAQTTSTCGWQGNQWVCNSGPDSVAAARQNLLETNRRVNEQLQQNYANLLAQQAARREAAERQDAQIEAERHALYAQQQRDDEDRARRDNEANFNKNLSELVLAGRCEDAKTFALQRNNLSAADQALRVCTPK
jgi:hypothetical protein